MSEDKELDRHMSEQMNPRVRTVSIGVRTLRKIKVCPLSVHDQFTLTDKINEGLLFYMQNVGELNADSVAKLVGFVRLSLPEVLQIACPDEDSVALLKDVDNFQLTEIAEHIFNDNYGDPVKKLSSLFRQKRTLEPMEDLPESVLGRLTQPSAGTTPATESNISPDSLTKKGESQAVN